jgi:hypothetical protein
VVCGTSATAWYAGAMTREECGMLVMKSNHGDFLIRDLADGARSICVNDQGSVRGSLCTMYSAIDRRA